MAKKSRKQKRRKKLLKEEEKRSRGRSGFWSRRPKVVEKVVLPLKGETCAIASKNKTAALCYDRIWSISRRMMDTKPGEVVPEQIRCFGGTHTELDVIAWIDYITIYLQKIRRLTQSMGSKEEVEAAIRKYMRKTLPKDSHFDRLMPGNMSSLPWNKVVRVFKKEFDRKVIRTDKDNYGTLILREVAKSFSNTYGISMVTLFETASERNREYKEGNREVVIAVLSDIEIIDEDKLTWEQVLEFRADEENHRRYKRFLHWLNKEMIGKSQAFIEDEISLKLEDYEKALKKHGIKTVFGMVEEALDGKYLLGASGVAGSLTLAGHPLLGMLGAGILIGGKVVVKLVQTKLNFDDVERGQNSEISWVYEAKKLSQD